MSEEVAMARAKGRGREEQEKTLSLVEAAEFLLEECRMVLPGTRRCSGFS